MHISVDHPDPEAAALIANRYVVAWQEEFAHSQNLAGATVRIIDTPRRASTPGAAALPATSLTPFRRSRHNYAVDMNSSSENVRPESRRKFLMRAVLGFGCVMRADKGMPAAFAQATTKNKKAARPETPLKAHSPFLPATPPIPIAQRLKPEKPHVPHVGA